MAGHQGDLALLNDPVAAERYFGRDQGQAWVGQLRGQPMARVAVRPHWVGILDFETRFPSALGL